ncbi:unnamed protein product [Arctia plantaginis]|uniref:Uncharacterized protein n=2 Tax=Arctia plantaginis TaxID=874455 RepID=A0A8S0ZBX5_ARCPL|nr:unnamed protein product [Arctia plantaginis]CAB3241523.1 unnamed protein product [Arctia plantaginis]
MSLSASLAAGVLERTNLPCASLRGLEALTPLEACRPLLAVGNFGASRPSSSEDRSTDPPPTRAGLRGRFLMEDGPE